MTNTEGLKPLRQQTNNTLTKEIEQSLMSIITQMRMMVGFIRQETGNRCVDIKEYLQDLQIKIKGMDQQIKKSHESQNAKNQQISKQKLEIKGLQNEYAEMKSSLMLQIQQQKLLLNGARQQLKQQKEHQQSTIKQYVVDLQRKKEQMTMQQQDYEQQIQQMKIKIDDFSRSSIKSIQQIEQQKQKDRIRSVGIENQKQKTITTYTQLIFKQREEIKTLIQKLKSPDVASNDNTALIEIIEYKSQFINKIQQLEAHILAKDEEVTKYSTLSKAQNKRCREYYHRLKQRQQQAQQFKQKINRLTRNNSNKETQIAQLRATLERVLRQREQSTRHMGTKWQHQIDRVLLNAQLQFDRQKNRIKKAADQRQLEIQTQLNQKINKLYNEQKRLKQIKINLLDKVQKLQEKCKYDNESAAYKISKLDQQIIDLTQNKIKISFDLKQLQSQYSQLTIKFQQSQLNKQTALKNLKNFEQGLQQKRKALQLSAEQNARSIEKKLQDQRKYLTQKFQKDHQTLLQTFEQKQKHMQQNLLAKLKIKQYELLQTIDQMKKDQQTAFQVKQIQINQQKQQAKRQFERSLRNTRKQFNEQVQQYNKNRQRLQRQLRQSNEIIKKHEQQIRKQKQTIQTLSSELKNINDTLQSTIKQKNSMQNSKQQIIQNKTQIFKALQKQKDDLSVLYQQLKTKYNSIKGEVNDAKEAMLKEHRALNQQHQKIIKGYKSYIKEIEQNCFTHSDIMVYMREIRKLRQINSNTETDLANVESKLMTLKEVTKYQVAKIQQNTNKPDKHYSTMRTSENLGQSQASFSRKSQGAFAKFQQREMTKSIDNFDQLTNPLQTGVPIGYEKLSKQKKRQGTSYQRSRVKRSKVGFTQIDTYSILSNSKQQFRLSSIASLSSPQVVRCVRSALQK